MGTKSFLAVSIILVLLIGSVSFDYTFADKDNDKKKDKNKKTFESECAKKLDKKKLSLDGLFCQAIIAIQDQLASLLLVQDDSTKPILELQVSPDSDSAPAILVKDENNVPLFIVNNDGSIQIGSNTIVINPDGTVTGPLHLEAGSTVDGELLGPGLDGQDGEDGAQGPPGIAFVRGIEGETKPVSKDSGTLVRAFCEEGFATGGGFSSTNTHVTAYINKPIFSSLTGQSIGWFVIVTDTSSPAVDSGTVTALATCAELG